MASLLLFFLALPAFLPDAARWLELDRAAVARGEVWRLVTGHWTHWTLDHLLWDALMLLLLAGLCETLVSRRALLTAVAGSAVLISAGVWVALPGLSVYRGLSGIDSALFVLLAATLLRRESGATAALAGLGVVFFLIKAAWEVGTGSTLFAEAAGSFVPVPLAHLLGGAWGLVASGSGPASSNRA